MASYAVNKRAPTLSAATATTWAILRALDLEPVAPCAGTLLRPASRIAA